LTVNLYFNGKTHYLAGTFEYIAFLSEVADHTEAIELNKTNLIDGGFKFDRF
jgi:hypothetical protein